MIRSCLPLLFVLLTLPAVATDYYVSPSGNDTDPGTLAEPWKTINHAVTNDAWSTTGIVETDRVNHGDYNEVTVRDSVPITEANRRFLRLKVSRP